MSHVTSTDAAASRQGSEQVAAGEGSGATRQVGERAQQAAEGMRGQVSSQVDQRSTEAGERLRAMAGDAHTVGDELRKQGKDQPARLADQAADRVERLGGYLQEADGDRILSDLEGFGRRRPAALVAGGLAVGFLASRFLKASSAQRRGRIASSSGQQPAGATGTRPSGLAPHA
jgi:hypothetical protein